jgi:predicted ATPase with chaperone activity
MNDAVEEKVGEPKGAMPGIDDIIGHEGLRRAIEVALVGGHPMVIFYWDGSSAPVFVREVARLSRACGLAFHALATTSCPCGNYGSSKFECACSSKAILKHLERVARRRDEFDIFIESVGPRVNEKSRPEPFAECVRRVTEARLRPEPKGSTADIDLFREFQKLFGADSVVAEKVSAVAKSIARLEGSERLWDNHVAEACQYSCRSSTLLRNMGPALDVEEKV